MSKEPKKLDIGTRVEWTTTNNHQHVGTIIAEIPANEDAKEFLEKAGINLADYDLERIFFGKTTVRTYVSYIVEVLVPEKRSTIYRPRTGTLKVLTEREYKERLEEVAPPTRSKTLAMRVSAREEAEINLLVENSGCKDFKDWVLQQVARSNRAASDGDET